MRHPDKKSGVRWAVIAIACVVLHARLLFEQANALNILVDYRYDTNNFFNTQQKRDALEAAAARWGAIITTPLAGVSLNDDNTDPRIGFTHPGLGTDFQVSAANSAASDAIIDAGGSAANEYRGPWSIAANQWILYAGGRPLSDAGEGGTGSGTNFTTVFSDPNSHLNRGFRATGSSANLPLWGGSVTFDSDGSTAWNFDLNTPAPVVTADFYSIALHEIGHALGLNSNWSDWTSHSSGGHFAGAHAAAAYNADNGTTLTSLNEVSTTDHHWQDNTYDSFIFTGGNPNYVGTVGPSTKQDLLMEPVQDFTPSVRRFELTNVDVAALQDVGWSVVSPFTGNFNGDAFINAADYASWRKTNNTQPGYAAWRQHFNSPASASASADFDFAASVPEPASWILLAVALLSMSLRKSRVK